MKPKELITQKYVYKNNWIRGQGHTDFVRLIDKYSNKDCVIAYKESDLGLVLLIKGRVKEFGFVLLDYRLCNILQGTGYTMGRVFSMKELISLMGDNPTIVDKEAYERVKNKIVIDAL